MKDAGVIVNTALRVVICLGCRCLLQPSTIPSHVSKEHSLPVTPKFCEDLVKKYALRKEPTRPGKIVGASVFWRHRPPVTFGYQSRSDLSRQEFVFTNFVRGSSDQTYIFS